MNRQLAWYRYLVHNNSIPGSLFTLIHLPFMLAFLSLVVIGVAVFQAVDHTVLVLSLASYPFCSMVSTCSTILPGKESLGKLRLVISLLQ